MYDILTGGLLAFGIFGILLTVFISASWLIAYVLTSIGLYNIAAKKVIANPILAWIPIARYYLLGTILNNELVITPKGRLPYFQFILPLCCFLGLFSGFPGPLFSIAFVILLIVAYVSLFRQYREPNAIAYGLLAGIPFIAVVGSVFVYLLGDKPAPDPNADSTAFP